MKVIFCTPSRVRPTDHYIKSLEDSIPLIVDAGWTEGWVQELGCPYISSARATMTRKALDAKADVIVYIDDDLSWQPGALLKLLETPGDVVSGTYRFKKPEEQYMGCLICHPNGTPQVRDDGALKADRVPGGFLKVTAGAIEKFMTAYPELMFGPKYAPSIDLFNHGAHKGTWYGEDYAFSRNWIDAGGDIWIVPDLNINHHSADEVFAGNFHQFMLNQPRPS